jgi:hypothetical protein
VSGKALRNKEKKLGEGWLLAWTRLTASSRRYSGHSMPSQRQITGRGQPMGLLLQLYCVTDPGRRTKCMCLLDRKYPSESE